MLPRWSGETLDLVVDYTAYVFVPAYAVTAGGLMPDGPRLLSGETLDLVVDYTTYVFVPAYAVTAGHLMPDGFAVAAGIAIAITGTLYFADRNMKTSDNFFSGFPGGVESGGVLPCCCCGRRRPSRRPRWRCSRC